MSVHPAEAAERNAANFVTRSRAFQKLTKWAFTVCDRDQTGQVGKSELYAGILLVHVQLAKYAGPAACYPPSRRVIDDLFDASDDDQSGYISEDEFSQIMVICCGQIASRMMVYYAIIVLLVPYTASAIVTGFLTMNFAWSSSLIKRVQSFFLITWIEKIMTFGYFFEQVVYLALFYLLIPLFFNWIDRSSRQAAERTVIKSTVKNL
jgi:hypothetical protein